eukprot:349130_1
MQAQKVATKWHFIIGGDAAEGTWKNAMTKQDLNKWSQIRDVVTQLPVATPFAEAAAIGGGHNCPADQGKAGHAISRGLHYAKNGGLYVWGTSGVGRVYFREGGEKVIGHTTFPKTIEILYFSPRHEWHKGLQAHTELNDLYDQYYDDVYDKVDYQKQYIAASDGYGHVPQYNYPIYAQAPTIESNVYGMTILLPAFLAIAIIVFMVYCVICALGSVVGFYLGSKVYQAPHKPKDDAVQYEQV